jgi:hypothetical protein
MLPANFQFSQSNLQDYVDCPRRFQLRHFQAQAWPGVQAEPVLEYERHLERGARFHRLIERHQLGMDSAVLAATVAGDAELSAWWRDYLHFDYLHDLPGRRYPEFSLSVEIAGARLVAMYDLLVVVPGERVVIFDWKTYHREPSRQWFLARLQTRVYPFVLVSSGTGLSGGNLLPEQVSMVYWVAAAPLEPVVIDYNSKRLAVDCDYLSGLIREILTLGDGSAWSMTADESRCRFCEYRSLCDRGVYPGLLENISNIDDNIAGSVGFSVLGGVGEVGF